jgi:hypothetical protein
MRSMSSSKTGMGRVMTNGCELCLYSFSTFKLFENAWFQRRQGTLDPQQWQGWDAYIRMYYHRPGVKTWWKLRRAASQGGSGIALRE